MISNGRWCKVCGSPEVECHHIFFGPYRSKADKYGLTVYLCPTHHRDHKLGVHGLNKELDLRLKRLGQMKFEEKHSRKEFMKAFGRNYLDQDS